MSCLLKTLANRPVLAARRLLRSLRGPLSDKLIMLVASLIYAGKVDRAFIEERLGYMYFVPFRYADFSAKLKARGLRLVAETVATGALDTSLVFRYGPILSSVVASMDLRGVDDIRAWKDSKCSKDDRLRRIPGA